MVEASDIKRYSAGGNSLGILRAQFVGLGGVNHGAELELWQIILVVFNSERMPESQALDDRNVHFEEGWKKSALNHVARVGGTTLFGVFEAFANVRGEVVPV